MTAVALWLLLVGVLDLFRVGPDGSRPRLLLPLAAVGGALAFVLAALLRPTGAGWVAWCVASVGVVGWLVGSGLAGARFRGVALPGALARVTGVLAAIIGYASLAIGLVALLLAGPAGGSAPAVTTVLAGSGLAAIPPERTLVLAALAVVQVSTVNVIVRLLLDLVGVPANDNEKTLRGGRVLGPMERLLILGLGVAGSLAGAAAVVAGKSLLRFPELRVPRAGDPGYGGPSDITEYFLVGSFASWLLALGSVGLAGLAA